MDEDKGNYWITRAKRDMHMADKSIRTTTRKTIDAYETHRENIENQLYAFYKKYGDKDGNLLPHEVVEKMTYKDKAELDKAVKAYANMVKGGGGMEEVSAQRLRDRIKITRLDNLMTNIDKELYLLGGKVDMIVGNGLSDTFIATISANMFDISKDMGVAVNFDMPNTKAIEKAVSAKWLGENYSDRIWKDKYALVTKLEQLIPKAIAEGMSVNQVTKEMSKAMNVSKAKAETLIRTEMNKVLGDSRFETYEMTGVEKYQFIAVLDNRTSELCIERDNQVYLVSEAQVGVNRNPMHPRCRSTTVPYYEDLEEDFGPTERIAKDENGRNIIVRADMDVMQWAELYGDAKMKSKVESVLDLMMAGKQSVSLKAIPKNTVVKTTAQLAASIIQKLGDMGTQYAEVVNTIDPRILKQVEFTLQENQVSIMEDKKGQSYYHPMFKQVVMGNVKGDLKGTEYVAGRVLFHEFGHMVDDLLDGSLTFTHPRGIAKELLPALYKDMDSHLSKNYFRKYRGNGVLDDISGSTEYRSTYKDMKSMYPQGRVGFSDLINGYTKGKIHYGSGHEDGYFDNVEMYNSEFFAHVYSAYATGGRSGSEYLDYKLLFPNAIREFEVILDRIDEYITEKEGFKYD